jgi:hypothetical protein
MGTHDVVRDTFVTIAQDDGFHIGQKQLHALPSTIFNSFCQWVNIVLTKDGIYTSANITIVDLMHVDLFSWSWTIQRFVASNASQAKEGSYCNWQINLVFVIMPNVKIYPLIHIVNFNPP